MVNTSRAGQDHVSLDNEVIRNYAESFERHNYRTLAFLSFFVLSLSLFAFLEVWYGNYDPIVVLRLQITLVISVVLIIFVAFFWSLLAKPYFQILMIESANNERPRRHEGLLERLFLVRGNTHKRQRIALKTSFLLLFPIFLAFGFALSAILSQFNRIPLFVYYDTTPAGGFVNTLIAPNPPIGPLILVFTLFAFLFTLYFANPQRIQRQLLWLFAVPPALLLWVLFSQASRNGPRWWRDIVLGYGPANIVANELMFIGSRLALLVIVIVILYLIYHYNTKFREFYVYLTSKESHDLLENAEGLLPKRVHIGDAQSIFLDLKRSELCQQEREAAGTRSSDHLEVEIQAAGLKIDGDKRVIACETSSLSTSTWNCSFPTAGTQAINLIISVRQPPNNRNIVFAYKHDIRVDNFLSEAWKPLIAILTPILPILVSVGIR